MSNFSKLISDEIRNAPEVSFICVKKVVGEKTCNRADSAHDKISVDKRFAGTVICLLINKSE